MVYETSLFALFLEDLNLDDSYNMSGFRDSECNYLDRGQTDGELIAMCCSSQLLVNDVYLDWLFAVDICLS